MNTTTPYDIETCTVTIITLRRKYLTLRSIHHLRCKHKQRALHIGAE